MTVDDGYSRLQLIVQRCLQDPAFFERLTKDMSATLREANLEIGDEGARNALTQMLTGVSSSDVEHIREIVERFKGIGTDEWRPGWPMGWVPPLVRRR